MGFRVSLTPSVLFVRFLRLRRFLPYIPLKAKVEG